MVKIINLFSSRSLIPLNKQYKVQCYWFCVNRKQPVLPYLELISGYEPNKEGNEIVESAVNEYFTEQEIYLLENYLATKQIGLETEKVEGFPVNGEFYGLADSPLGGGAGFIELCEHNGYSLPFDVWGFYDYKDPDDLVFSPEE